MSEFSATGRRCVCLQSLGGCSQPWFATRSRIGRGRCGQGPVYRRALAWNAARRFAMRAASGFAGSCSTNSPAAAAAELSRAAAPSS